MEEENYEQLAQTQRLKAAVHYTVGRICEEESDGKEYQYSKQLIAVLAENTFRHIKCMAEDLELFAKHAKRNTINSEDVKLLVRKSPKLHEHVKEFGEQIAAESEEKKKVRQKKKSLAATKKPQNDDTATNVDEDSNAA